MKLLSVTKTEYDQLAELFEEVETVGVQDLSPEVIDGETDVKLNGESISRFDAAFFAIPVKNDVFGRVLLDMVEKQGLPINYPATAFFIMARKNYLYHVLHEKNVPAPRTLVVASERALRSIEDDIELPAIGRRLEDLEVSQTKLLETYEDLYEFAEGTEYGHTLLLFHEYTDGEKYRCLVTEDQIISLADESEEAWVGHKNLKYSTLSDERAAIATSAINSIGTPIAEVLLIGDEVVDVNPNPDFEQYTDISGKNAFSVLKPILTDEDDAA